MVIEVVHGNALEDRLGQLLHVDRKNVKIRMISQHVYDVNIKNMPLLKKLERLIRHNGRVVLIIDREVYGKSHAVQKAVEELENINVRVFVKRNIHAKIVLLEAKNDKGFLLSSANLSHTALHINREAGIFLMNEPTEALFNQVNEFFKKILGNDF